MHRIARGLDIPIAGAPEQTVDDGRPVTRVALVGDDYNGMKPTLEVKEGDKVARGQLLFTDKKTAGVRYVSPGAGTVLEINRGDKRVFQSIVIHLDGDDTVTCDGVAGTDVLTADREKLVEQLNEGGLWTALRTRPFSKVPALDSAPRSIFVQAIDTNPHAADPFPLILEREADFVAGLKVLSRLTDGKVYLCKEPGKVLPGADVERVQPEEFDGPHPAGLPGTHIHLLDPVSPTKVVWTINYQDVIAFGEFYRTGQFPIDRIVAVGGPAVTRPRLLKTRIGADIEELLGGELNTPGPDEPAIRAISGSVLNGRAAKPPFSFLGRYHLQVSALVEGTNRELIGWLLPGKQKHSVTGMYVGHWTSQEFDLTTNQQGSKRAIVPIGTYEDVMPLDILPTYLLRALVTDDTDQAQALGCLELDEEDLALCTYVCPAKNEYGDILRRNLSIIEREG